MHIINDSVVRGRLSENYLTRKFILLYRKILDDLSSADAALHKSSSDPLSAAAAATLQAHQLQASVICTEVHVQCISQFPVMFLPCRLLFNKHLLQTQLWFLVSFKLQLMAVELQLHLLPLPLQTPPHNFLWCYHHNNRYIHMTHGACLVVKRISLLGV